jgi:hypothetical protein
MVVAVLSGLEVRVLLIAVGVVLSLLVVYVSLLLTSTQSSYSVLHVPGSPVIVCSSSGVVVHVPLRNLGPGVARVTGIRALGEHVSLEVVVQPGETRLISHSINATCPSRSPVPVVVETSVGDIAVYAMVYS